MAEHVIAGDLQPSHADGHLATANHDAERRPSNARNTFLLHIFPTTTYKHKTMIRHSPLHGPWPDEKPSSFATSALRVVVPKDMAGKAMWNWETGGQSERTPPPPPEKIHHIQGRIQRRESRARSKGLVSLQTKDERPPQTESAVDNSSSSNPGPNPA